MRYTAEALTKLRAASSAGGTMGCAERRSHRANPARRTTPARRGPATSGDPQGRDAACVSPRVTDTSPSALAAAPRQSRRREPRFLDSRTAVIVTAAAATANGMLTQNTDAYPKKVRSTPPATG